MWTTQVGSYALPEFPVNDLEKWHIMPYRWTQERKYTEAEKARIRTDTTFQIFSRHRRNSFEEFKHFIMDVDKISATEFERRFEIYDSLASFYNLLSFLSLWNVQSAIAKKNDSSFYILGPSLSQGYLLSAPSTGGKPKKSFSSTSITAVEPIALKRPRKSAPTIRPASSNCREATGFTTTSPKTLSPFSSRILWISTGLRTSRQTEIPLAIFHRKRQRPVLANTNVLPKNAIKNDSSTGSTISN